MECVWKLRIAVQFPFYSLNGSALLAISHLLFVHSRLKVRPILGFRYTGRIFWGVFWKRIQWSQWHNDLSIKWAEHTRSKSRVNEPLLVVSARGRFAWFTFSALDFLILERLEDLLVRPYGRPGDRNQLRRWLRIYNKPHFVLTLFELLLLINSGPDQTVDRYTWFEQFGYILVLAHSVLLHGLWKCLPWPHLVTSLARNSNWSVSIQVQNWQETTI